MGCKYTFKESIEPGLGGVSCKTVQVAGPVALATPGGPVPSNNGMMVVRSAFCEDCGVSHVGVGIGAEYTAYLVKLDVDDARLLIEHLKSVTDWADYFNKTRAQVEKMKP